MIDRARSRLSRVPPLRRGVVAYRHLGVTDADAFLLSYPRSGNTWLRLMLAGLAREKETAVATFDNVRFIIPEVGGQRSAPRLLPGGGRIIKSHELGTGRYRRRCVPAVYVIRDGRDVCVSYYYWSLRHGTFDGSLTAFTERFLAGDVGPYGAWHTHPQSWLEDPAAAARIEVVRYEDCLAEPERMLGSVASSLGIGADPDLIRETVEMHSFERMQSLEQQSDRLRRSSERDDIPVVRAGRSGEWRDAFSDRDASRFEAVAGETLGRYGYL